MKLSDEEIYGYARQAGFSADEAVTMTAIALAESGGDPMAVNDRGEYSIGLWQINLKAHPDYTVDQALDPATNARLAFEVSGQGADIGRWTVTHRAKGARYLEYRERAEAAAVASGEHDAVGSWQPPLDYDAPPIAADPDLVTAEALGHAQTPALTGNGSEGPAPLDEDDPLRIFLNAALAQDGDTYVFGAVASADDLDPDEFDCAELVQWAAAQADIEVPTGSWLQYLHVKERGAVMSLEEALNTPGALIFRFSEEPVPGGGRPSSSHVAISLGDGDGLIEARGKSYGVGLFSASERGFTHAGYIPELGTELVGPMPTGSLATLTLEAPPDPGVLYEFGQDSDDDGLVDSLEDYLGTDPFHPDTDLDGVPDVREATDFNTDPLDYHDNHLASGVTGEAPRTTSDRRSEVEAAQERVEAYEEQLAEQETEQAKIEERAHAEQVRATAEQRADEIREAAEQKADEIRQEGLDRAEELRQEEIERQEAQHGELIQAIRGEGFAFSTEQIETLMSEDHGLDAAELDSLTLAIRDDRLEDWFELHHDWFEEGSEYADADAFTDFQEWIDGDLAE